MIKLVRMLSWIWMFIHDGSQQFRVTHGQEISGQGLVLSLQSLMHMLSTCTVYLLLCKLAQTMQKTHWAPGSGLHVHLEPTQCCNVLWEHGEVVPLCGFCHILVNILSDSHDMVCKRCSGSSSDKALVKDHRKPVIVKLKTHLIPRNLYGSLRTSDQ